MTKKEQLKQTIQYFLDKGYSKKEAEAYAAKIIAELC